jgi:hypothetical protein
MPLCTNTGVALKKVNAMKLRYSNLKQMKLTMRINYSKAIKIILDTENIKIILASRSFLIKQ